MVTIVAIKLKWISYLPNPNMKNGDMHKRRAWEYIEEHTKFTGKE